jgi:hypothetical protein
MSSSLVINQEARRALIGEIPSTPMQDLPDELMLEIFMKLPTLNNVRVNSLICKKWNIILGDNIIWKFFIKRDFLISTNTQWQSTKAHYRYCYPSYAHSSMIKAAFPPERTPNTCALQLLNQIQIPAAKMEAFAAVLNAGNSTNDIARKFWLALPAEMQAKFNYAVYVKLKGSSYDKDSNSDSWDNFAGSDAYRTATSWLFLLNGISQWQAKAAAVKCCSELRG